MERMIGITGMTYELDRNCLISVDPMKMHPPVAITYLTKKGVAHWKNVVELYELTHDRKEGWDRHTAEDLGWID